MGDSLFNPIHIQSTVINTQSGQKQSGNFGEFTQTGAYSLEIFEGKMLISILPTTPPEIFCEIYLHFLVIVKRLIGSDDNFKGNLYASMGYNILLYYLYYTRLKI